MTKRNFISIFLIFSLVLALLPVPVAVAAPTDHPNTYVNTGDLCKDILGVAASQIGYKEGCGNDTKYGDWYGMPKSPWCAMFVSWCADQANVPQTILKKSAKASPAASFFDIKYRSGSPKPGDLFFEKSFTHVGFVYKVEDGYFISIEGNSDGGGSNNGDGVVSNRRRISSVYFASPDYDKDRGVTLDFNLNGGSIAGSSLTYDRYEVLSSDGIKLRSNAGTSHSKLTALPKGTKFVVTDKKAADGYTWGKTTFSGMTGWCVISESWTKKIGTVSSATYKANEKGQLLSASTSAKITQRVSASAGSISLPSNSTFGISRKGYTFAGWSTAPIGGTFFKKGNSYSAAQLDPNVAKKNVSLSLYAVWMPANLTVSYHANGAFIRSDNYFVDSNILYKTNETAPYLQNWAAGETKPNGPTNCSSFGLYKPGYTFAGWGTKASGGNILPENGALSSEELYLANENKSNVVFYAIWKANTLSVQYHANGGALNSSTYQSESNGIYKGSAIYQQKWTYNQAKATGLVNDTSFGLSRSGYRFIGWSLKPQGGAVLNMDNAAILPTDLSSGIRSKSQTVTLYAAWAPNSHNHKFTTYIYNHDATGAADGTETATCSCGATDIRIKTGSMLINSASFKDVSAKAWYKQSMDYAVTYKILTGDGKNSLLPKKVMTRAEFVQMLANLSGVKLERSGEAIFDDVAPKAWYAPAVEWAVENEIADGTGKGKFSPDGKLTREQLCTMLVRYAESQKVSLKFDANHDLFTDDREISSWARKGVYTCFSSGIVSGVSENEFSPSGYASRAEAATMIMRFHKAY